MAGSSGNSQLPDQNHAPNMVQSSSPAADPTEELSEGIKKLSTDDVDSKSENILSGDDEVRSWSSGEDTVVEEPSDVDNRRQDAIDRIMKSFCATLETKLSSLPETKPKKRDNDEQSRPSDLEKTPSPAAPPRLSSFRSQPKPSKPPSATPKLSDFKSQPSSLPPSSGSSLPTTGMRLADFKLLSKQSSPPSEPPTKTPKLSDFKSQPSSLPSSSGPSPPTTGMRLADFKLLPKQSSPPSVPPSTIPKLSDFRSKSSPSSSSSGPSLPKTGMRLADFKLLPKPSSPPGQHHFLPAFDPRLFQSPQLAFPAISQPEPASKPSTDPSPSTAAESKTPTESAPSVAPAPTISPASEAAFARLDASSAAPQEENKTEDDRKGAGADKNKETGPNISEEERRLQLLHDVLEGGERLDSLEKDSDLAALAQTLKATAEAHTSGGPMWDALGSQIGDLLSRSGAVGAPVPSASSPGAFHGSFVSRTPMVSAPQPTAQQQLPVTPPQNFPLRSFSGSHFGGPLSDSSAGYGYRPFVPMGGPVQLDRPDLHANRRTSESSVQSTRSSQTTMSRKRREHTIEESESEEEYDDSPRPGVITKRKPTGYQQRPGTAYAHEVVDEPDGDGRRKKARKTASDGLGGGKQKFACPYFKRNPRKYRNWTSCPGPGWEEVHRVKTHLYRRHALPLQCPRCWDIFKTDNLLQGHLQMDPSCTVKSNSVPHEGFTKDQEKRLRSRKKAHADMTDEDKWNEIYTILFPDDDPDSIPGPYYDTFDDDEGTTPASGSASGSGDLDDYASFVRREMPTLVRRELEALFKAESCDVEDRLRPKIEQIVLDLQPRLMSLYKQSQIPLSEYGPAQQQPDYGFVGSMATPTSTPGRSPGCGAGVSPSSGISPGYVTSPPPVGMLTPESTTGHAADVTHYGGFMNPNVQAMMPNAGLVGGYPMYTTETALLGTGGGSGFDFDAGQLTGVGNLNWDDEFDRLLDPGVFMPQSGEVIAGGYSY